MKSFISVSSIAVMLALSRGAFSQANVSSYAVEAATYTSSAPGGHATTYTSSAAGGPVTTVTASSHGGPILSTIYASSSFTSSPSEATPSSYVLCPDGWFTVPISGTAPPSQVTGSSWAGSSQAPISVHTSSWAVSSQAPISVHTSSSAVVSNAPSSAYASSGPVGGTQSPSPTGYAKRQAVTSSIQASSVVYSSAIGEASSWASSSSFTFIGDGTASPSGPVIVTGDATAVPSGPVIVTGDATAVSSGPVAVTGEATAVPSGAFPPFECIPASAFSSLYGGDATASPSVLQTTDGVDSALRQTAPEGAAVSVQAGSAGMLMLAGVVTALML
ncbi:hypothetical protein BDV98DRAFT_81761 [Pterulicium gracile]|uniref:Uncharacterized protein n=1 Tax=Pterulicium gracile TaxID=1884261 RepID=A0A5C3QLW8_9AGAR|nr:hypothetical protein BDV98DRAFT_81761 [Pterula gracilis]